MIKLFFIVGDDRVIIIPPPSRYTPAPCSSIHFVPVPPVIVNPAKTAVLSSPETILTQLAESGLIGLLPSIIVEII